jgi:hypothetical protein
MMEFDIGVFFFKFPFLSIQLHRSMAVTTREHPLGHWRRLIFFNDCYGRGGEKNQQKQYDHYSRR